MHKAHINLQVISIYVKHTVFKLVSILLTYSEKSKGPIIDEHHEPLASSPMSNHKHAHTVAYQQDMTIYNKEQRQDVLWLSIYVLEARGARCRRLLKSQIKLKKFLAACRRTIARRLCHQLHATKQSQCYVLDDSLIEM